ncbi:hypothetical protein [Flavobacterium gelatinilyticum]|uniref:hypothetical protein n=1 Tax=Flavobacterium gelatinilyticum TaxID=3003260 RepID=UPI0024816ACA|nr:hypothetical protein [Flavobacterium gelatinilyticum]
MKQSIIIFISLLLFSCSQKEKAFDSFEYSFGGTFSELYSLKFTENDTVYVYQEWIRRNFDDSISQPKSKTQYYGIINLKEKSKLYDYIGRVNLFKYKSEYYEDYLDGSLYALEIKKNNKTKTILVHSHEVPKELDSISDWIGNIKKQLVLKETEKHINYVTSNLVFPPPPPSPPIKNSNN